MRTTCSHDSDFQNRSERTKQKPKQTVDDVCQALLP